MQVFVFDLDFTLWNSGDTFCSETIPPYFWRNNELFDQEGRWIRLYPDTIKVLESLVSENIAIVAASRTHQPERANNLLELLDINKYFGLKEIYPGSKIVHLQRIKKHFGIPYNQIFFFDDEKRNIDDVSDLGVVCWQVDNGIKMEDINSCKKKLLGSKF